MEVDLLEDCGENHHKLNYELPTFDMKEHNRTHIEIRVGKWKFPATLFLIPPKKLIHSTKKEPKTH